jgi:AraC-like DNA-binding protein
MDRHDVSEDVTAQMIAQLHHQDLQIQDQYDCKGLTYWFDDVRKTAFCLVEAPNKQCLINMHNDAHGEIPHRIIEVDPTIVESFLGRIEDPEKSQKTELNIINDPAFRILVNIKTTNPISDLIRVSSISFEGNIVTQSLVSFTNVTKALEFSIQISVDLNTKSTPFGIGISSGIPVSEKDQLFEDTIKLAQRYSSISRNEIRISQEVFELFQSTNQNKFPYQDKVKVTKSTDEKFLNTYFDYLEQEWRNPELKVENFSTILGYSKSSFYRILKNLTGKSPHGFLNDYRLEQAHELLKFSELSISEIAFNTGFNSPSYFSKCFLKKYNSLPSNVHTEMSGK